MAISHSILFSIIFLLTSVSCLGQQDPLPSWHDGHAKRAIIAFVQDTTRQGSQDYLIPEDRIAVFDQDGTLWVEQPLYTQFFFAIDTLQSLSAQHPDWKHSEPYRSILAGDHNEIQNFSIQDITKIIEATHANMTVDQFKETVQEWLNQAVHPRFQKPFTALIYQPMIEVIQYLKTHGYKVYIVSGGGQDFIRAYSEKIYGISSEQIIGSSGKVKYEYQNNHSVLTKLPEMLFINDKQGKPEAINLFIGKRPVAAFGNSDGDKQMLEWSQTHPKKSLQILVHHDDPVREYAYDHNSKIGPFSQSLMDEAKARNWAIVSMKNDWKVIFPWESARPVIESVSQEYQKKKWLCTFSNSN